MTAVGAVASKADWKKAVFDKNTNCMQDLLPFSVGQFVKLWNEAYTKGSAHWF